MRVQREEQVLGGFTVRVVTVDGTDWWCAADLARAFGSQQDGGQFTRGVPESFKGLIAVETLGGMQAMACVTWTGVTYLAALTRTPEAESAFLALLAGHDKARAMATAAATAIAPVQAPAFDPQQLAAVVARAVSDSVSGAIMRGIAQGRRDGIWERKRRAAGQEELPGMLSPAAPLPVAKPTASARILEVLGDLPTGVERVAQLAKCSDKTARVHLHRLAEAGHAIHSARFGWMITAAGRSARTAVVPQ